MKKLTLLLAGLAVIFSGSVLAQDDSDSPRMILGPFSQTDSFEPAASAPPAILADFVAVDAPLAKTPCFNCVNGTTKGTFGLSQPSAYIPTSFTPLQLVVYYQNISYTGACKVTFTLKKGSTTVYTVTNNVAGFAANTVGFVFQQAKRPTASGAGSLTVSLKCGTNPAASATGSLYFQ